MPRGDDKATMARFAERYRVAQTDATRMVEQAVIGGDWGANGYTTMVQADRLGDVLGLGPGALMLDLGAGRGWPGLYLAAATGCTAVLADVPVEGLRNAAARARIEGLTNRAVVVTASARGLPFRASVFDSVVHTDVLC